MRLRGLVTIAAAAGVAATSASADQVIPDDLIVQSSLCSGTQCVNNEAFGFDTVRMKGPVLRLSFEDTSVGAFPTTDWQLIVNDEDVFGTADHFSFADMTAGTVPFTIEGGAPTGSLRVTADGRVGLGTIAPEPGFKLDVAGNVRIDGSLTVTGVTAAAGTKAGVVAGSAFVAGQTTVTFTTPFADDYTVLLSALGDKPTRRFKPAVIARDANGFTISAGKKSTTSLVEVHWIAQRVGE